MYFHLFLLVTVIKLKRAFSRFPEPLNVQSQKGRYTQTIILSSCASVLEKVRKRLRWKKRRERE